MWITLNKTMKSKKKHENVIVNKEYVYFYLPNGMALLCWESKKWILSENNCNGNRTNGKSNVELTTKFDGQWIVQ